MADKTSDEVLNRAFDSANNALKTGPGLAATPTAIASGTGDVQGIAATPNLRLAGFSAKEDAGTPAAAEFILRHGTGAGDPALVYIKLAASESKIEYFGDAGIACANGIFVDRVSGTTAIVLYTKTV